VIYAESFHTKKTLLQTLFERSAILDRKRLFCVSETFFGGLRSRVPLSS